MAGFLAGVLRASDLECRGCGGLQSSERDRVYGLCKGKGLVWWNFDLQVIVEVIIKQKLEVANLHQEGEISDGSKSGSSDEMARYDAWQATL